ncbi:MAG: radical SAM protein, partial [Parasporobacterium sp.]|nr:radical SAM protein [Parasporobacterium sp.]
NKQTGRQMLTDEEMIQAVSVAASLGATKVRVTGGEPLLKKNICAICSQIAKIEGIGEVSMTTNGILLPEYAKDLVLSGVSRINISLDTLDEEKYRYLTGGELNDALKGIDAALSAGFIRVKINAVLIGGFNDGEIRDLAALTKTYPVDVRFIELMPMQCSEKFDPGAYLSCDAVMETLKMELVPVDDDGVAKRYRYGDGKGFIGLIRPVTDNFCSACNRLRLTADGKIKPCLHDNQEISIKGMDKDEMREAFIKAASLKPEWHGPLSPCFISGAKRGMHRIGGYECSLRISMKTETPRWWM